MGLKQISNFWGVNHNAEIVLVRFYRVDDLRHSAYLMAESFDDAIEKGKRALPSWDAFGFITAYLLEPDENFALKETGEREEYKEKEE